MKKKIVLTGATSGFGAAALKQLVSSTDHSIVVGARNPNTIEFEFGGRVTALPLDLASLSSVRDFCQSIPGGSLNVLGMNAGMQTRKLNLTEDGFETTFQVNFLSHFLMFDLLKDRLAPDATIVTTGSGTHDPEEKTPVPAPKHANVKWMAKPADNPEADRMTPIAMARSYSTSKMFCIMMAKEIAARHPNFNVVSFDPGYLPDTNLSREYPKFLASIVKRVIPYTMKNDRTGSVSTTAPEYTKVLLGELKPEEIGGYMVMRSGSCVEAPASELVRSHGVSSSMWDDSLDLLSAET